MAESANALARVGVVEGVAAVRGGEAELAAVVDRVDVLENGVDRLEDAAVELLELAQLDRVIDAIVLEVVGVGGRLECARPGHGVTVHVRQTAVTRHIVVVGGSVEGRRRLFLDVTSRP